MNNDLLILEDFKTYLQDIKNSSLIDNVKEQVHSSLDIEHDKQKLKKNIFKLDNDDIIDDIIDSIYDEITITTPKEEYSAVFDLEFYGGEHELGNIKQLGLILFDNQYNIIETYENTVIDKADIQEIKDIIIKYFYKANKVFHWGGISSDIPAIKKLKVNMNNINFVDAQEIFRVLKLKSKLGDVYTAIGGNPAGAHNALIDTKFTFEIIKSLDIADVNNNRTLHNFCDVLRFNAVEVSPGNLLSLSNKPDYIQPIRDKLEKLQIQAQKSDSFKMHTFYNIPNKYIDEFEVELNNLIKEKNCWIKVNEYICPTRNTRNKYDIIAFKGAESLLVYLK